MSNTSNGVITDPFDLGTPEKPRQKVKLFDASDNVLDLTEIDSGKTDPFEQSWFEGLSNWLGKHGPALAHTFLIVGSAAGTVTNALHFAETGQGLVHTLLVTLLFCGLVIEFGFAYAWKKAGSTDLAGNQVKTVNDLYNLSSIIMIGDLSLSVAEIAFGIGEIAAYWVGIVQPIGAVFIIRLFYRLKQEHPMTKAMQKVATLKARAQAGAVENEAQNMQLLLDEEKHERFMRRAALNERMIAGQKIVSGRWFRGQIKRATKDAVGKTLLPNIRAKVKNLPNLLRLPRSRKN